MKTKKDTFLESLEKAGWQKLKDMYFKEVMGVPRRITIEPKRFKLWSRYSTEWKFSASFRFDETTVVLGAGGHKLRILNHEGSWSL